MQTALVAELRQRRPHINSRWVDLLPAEFTGRERQVERTLDEVFCTLGGTVPGADWRGAARVLERECRSGQNALLGYFAAGEQALQEVLHDAKSSMPSLAPNEQAAAIDDLNFALGAVALREREEICRYCRYSASRSAATRTTALTPTDRHLATTVGASAE